MAQCSHAFQLHTQEFYDRMRREYNSSNNEPIHVEIFYDLKRLVATHTKKIFPPARNFSLYEEAFDNALHKFFSVTVHNYLSEEFAKSHPTDNLRLAYLHTSIRNTLIDYYRSERARGNIPQAEPDNDSAPKRFTNTSMNTPLPDGSGELGDLFKDTSEDFTITLENREEGSALLKRILLNNPSSPDKRVVVVYSLLRGISHNSTVEGNLADVVCNALNGKSLDACLDLVYAELKASDLDSDMVSALRSRLSDEQRREPVLISTRDVTKWRNTNRKALMRNLENVGQSKLTVLRGGKDSDKIGKE